MLDQWIGLLAARVAHRTFNAFFHLLVIKWKVSSCLYFVSGTIILDFLGKILQFIRIDNVSRNRQTENLWI